MSCGHNRLAVVRRGGEDPAGTVFTDRYRLPSQRKVVALFDLRVVGVEVGVKDLPHT